MHTAYNLSGCIDPVKAPWQLLRPCSSTLTITAVQDSPGYQELITEMAAGMTAAEHHSWVPRDDILEVTSISPKYLADRQSSRIALACCLQSCGLDGECSPPPVIGEWSYLLCAACRVQLVAYADQHCICHHTMWRLPSRAQDRHWSGSTCSSITAMCQLLPPWLPAVPAAMPQQQDRLLPQTLKDFKMAITGRALHDQAREERQMSLQSQMAGFALHRLSPCSPALYTRCRKPLWH